MGVIKESNMSDKEGETTSNDNSKAIHTSARAQATSPVAILIT
jgi:hypothetical protein